MDIFAQMVEKIIKEQEAVVGPIALDRARKVSGLSFDLKTHKVTFQGDGKEILEQLVEQYKQLFGQASVEVCKDAVKSLLSKLPQEQMPKALT